MLTEKEQIGLAYLTLGNKYLWLVKCVLEENAQQGQTGIRSYNYEPTKEQVEKDNRWSFRMVIIPLLFNFFHGLELSIKGFLVLVPGYKVEPNHKLTALLEDFKRNYENQNDIIIFLQRYIDVEFMPPYLQKWLTKQNLNIDKYYDFLRYPYSFDFKRDHNYFDIKYDLDRSNPGIDLSRSIVQDIDSILPTIGRAFDEMTATADKN